MKIKKISLLILLFILGFNLSSCNSISELWFYKDESWKLERSFEINYDILPSLSFDGLGFDTGVIVESLMDVVYPYSVNIWNQNGIDVSYKKETSDKNVKYHFSFKGNDIESFLKLYEINEELLNSEDYTEYVDYIEMFTPNVQLTKLLNDRYLLIINYPEDNTFGMLGETFILHGNKIDTNLNNKSNEKIAEWNSPILIQAEFSPVNKFINYSIVKKISIIVFSSTIFLFILFYLKNYIPNIIKLNRNYSRKHTGNRKFVNSKTSYLKKNKVRSNYGNRKR